ncbi:hypothetical protein I302_102563 [Kwoniella bestiolae CBS 10118]|uniref:Vacuolar protein sorting-associated protein 51 homolog n=1 Tax=Kwoniella bestiolae CBS 10118 TaxID=1296100 RepID=A0A1B9GFF3_9TREE|nr:hypothetical protein I302_01249 [Kwoniella bestiolae CBS 10118]OCF29736.1 hypothetical protein I302_01249 [Kwoniella bestiolae CBS 10118]
MSSSPIPRRHSEMPQSTRATPPRKISTFTDAGTGSGEMRRGSSTAGAGAGASAEQRKARREQFRNFYGIKEGQGQTAESPVDVGKKGDPLDIDSPSFNASAYYEDLISKSNLKKLMEKASGLNSDIGNLEGSRHSLVYNHHHQLFSAGDTISKLNSRTPQLLSIVGELQESFGKIEQLIDSISVVETNSQVERAEDQEGKDVLVEELKGGKRRLELMRVAKLDPATIRATYDGLIQKVNDTDKQNGEIQVILKELEKLVGDVPKIETAA